MLESNNYGGDSPKMASERCQPDYEGMIKRTKVKLDHSQNLRDAILSYFEGRKAKDKMAELIGEIVTECNSLQKEYDSLIEAQANEEAK